MICECCTTRLVNQGWENYCPGCGYVPDETVFTQLCDYDQFAQGIPVYPHEANEQQTQKLIIWKNRRMIIKLPKNCRRVMNN